jgi:cytoskeleton protein RodZ
MTHGRAGGVGAGLRRAREERGIPLRDIAAATKISPVALDAIEADDIVRLPGGIFTRAFVKAYAAHLGLNPDATLRAFVDQFPGATAEHFPETVPPPPPAPSRPVWAGRPLLQLGLVSLPLVLALAWFVVTRVPTQPRLDADRIAAMRADAPAPAVARPVADVESVAMPEAVPAVQHEEGLTIVLTPRADCWISASTDGRPVVERLLEPGEQVVLKARRSVVFKVGDASAVSLQVNGAIGRELGGPGEVVTTRIDQDNFRDFVAAP